ncbi:MAG: hypothetical protein ACLQG5_04260 [Methanobacterium sp.]|jgi:hypothetical protein
MGVEEEIFEEFFNKLEKNEEFPKAVLDDLKIRYIDGNLDSKAKIDKALSLGDSDED